MSGFKLFGGSQPWAGPRERRGLLSENHGTPAARRDFVKQKAREARRLGIEKQRRQQAQRDRRQAEQDRKQAAARKRDARKGQGWLF